MITMACARWKFSAWRDVGCVIAVQVWVLDSMVGQAKLCAEEPRDVHNVIQEVLKIPTPVPSREWVRLLVALVLLVHTNDTRRQHPSVSWQIFH